MRYLEKEGYIDGLMQDCSISSALRLMCLVFWCSIFHTIVASYTTSLYFLAMYYYQVTLCPRYWFRSNHTILVFYSTTGDASLWTDTFSCIKCSISRNYSNFVAFYCCRVLNKIDIFVKTNHYCVVAGRQPCEICAIKQCQYMGADNRDAIKQLHTTAPKTKRQNKMKPQTNETKRKRVYSFFISLFCLGQLRLMFLGYQFRNMKLVFILICKFFYTGNHSEAIPEKNVLQQRF